MIIRSLFSLVLVLVISILLIINTENLLTEIQNKSVDVTGFQIESQISNLKLSKFKVSEEPSSNFINGSSKQYDLVGKNATIYRSGMTEIRDINLKLYQDDNPNQFWQLLANQSKHNQDTTQLIGEVRAFNKALQVRLESENLWINHNQKKIFSNTNVSYQMLAQKVLAEGIEIDYYHKIVNFEPNVKSWIKTNDK